MGAPTVDLPGYGSSLAWSFLSLGLVCVVGYVFLRWLSRKGVGRSDGCVRVLGRCYLEAKRSAYLLEAGGRCFLIGVGEGPLTLLAEIDRAAIPADAPEGEKPGSGFAGVLAHLLRRRDRRRP